MLPDSLLSKRWVLTKQISHPLLNLLTTILVLAGCARLFSKPLWSANPLGLAEDDFYYYLKPAQELAWSHHATAFPHVLTNGYHPLYFAFLTFVSLFVRTIPGVYRVLWILDVLSATSIFVLSRRLFVRITAPLPANWLAVAMTSLCVSLICCQMEVTIALPLGFAFLLACCTQPETLTQKRAVSVGLLAAFTILARLDAAILVLLVCVGLLTDGAYRRVLTPYKVASFLAGFLPFPLLYFWSNYYFFHMLLPVSGAAKELRHGAWPSVVLFRTFLGVEEFLANLAIAGVVLAFALRKHFTPSERLFLFAVLAYPFLFYGLLAVISDWPIWPWYFYVLRFSLAGTAMLGCVAFHRSSLLLHSPRIRALALSPFVNSILLICALGELCVLQKYHVNVWMPDIQTAAITLEQFARTHPGSYAMGDRAGAFMIQTNQPVLQTEGLVMDRTYLDHIRRQDDLRTVLSKYRIDYYVAFVPESGYNMQLTHGCFHAMEPLLAGPLSLRMRSNFCEAPVYRFAGKDGIYLMYQLGK